MIFHYVDSALMCEEEIPGVTWDVTAHSSKYYDSSWYGGFRYFVAESMTTGAARRIAHGLGGILWEGAPPSRQLVGATVDLSRELSRHAMYGEHPRPLCR